MARDSFDTVGQIVSNYQAALHMLEEAVTSGYGEALPRALAREVRRRGARARGPGEGVHRLGRRHPPARAGGHVANLVVAERQRVAATHSRLIRRQLALIKAAEDRAAVDRRSLVTAAGRLDVLETGSHSAAALFQVLFDRWRAASTSD